jgi:hypothetical protein
VLRASSGAARATGQAERLSDAQEETERCPRTADAQEETARRQRNGRRPHRERRGEDGARDGAARQLVMSSIAPE